MQLNMNAVAPVLAWGLHKSAQYSLVCIGECIKDVCAAELRGGGGGRGEKQTEGEAAYVIVVIVVCVCI
jgi:hypothetical protein